MQNVPSSSPDPLMMIEKFEKTLPGKYSHNTIASYTTIVQSLYERFAKNNIPLLYATAEQLEKDREELKRRGLQAASIALYTTVAKHFFRFLIAEGVRDTDPLDGVRASRPWRRRSEPARPVTSQEIDKILDTFNLSDPIQRRDHLILTCLFTTEIKSSLLLGLTLNQIDLMGVGRGLVFKKMRGRPVEMVFDEDLLQKIRTFIQLYRPQILGNRESEYVFASRGEGPMVHQTPWFKFINRLREVGIERITINDVRRSYAKIHKQKERMPLLD